MASSAVYAAILLSLASLAWTNKVTISNGTLFAFSCNTSAAFAEPAVMLYFKDIRYVMGNSTRNISMAETGVPLQELSQGCNGTKLSQNATTIVASVNVTDGDKIAKFDFHFQRTNGRLSPKTSASRNSSFYWELTTIAVKTDDAKESVCFLPANEDDWVIAPRNFSFSCQPQRTWIPLNATRSWRTRQNHAALNATCSNSNTTAKVHLNITGLQVQAFTFISGKVRFDDSIDCVGYFSGPTLMGFGVGFFLLSVVFLTSLIFLGTETPSFSFK